MIKREHALFLKRDEFEILELTFAVFVRETDLPVVRQIHDKLQNIRNGINARRTYETTTRKNKTART